MSDEELLPDFNDMDKLARVSSRARLEAEQAELELKEFIAGCVKRVYIDKSLWYGDKQPTTTYIDKVVAIAGNNEEDARKIRELQLTYIEKYSQYEETKNLLENMHDRIDVFQSVSANKRRIL